MIISKHEDGRIIIMASEHNLKPMVKLAEGAWGSVDIFGYEFSEFYRIKSAPQRDLILAEAIKFAEENPKFKIK